VDGSPQKVVRTPDTGYCGDAVYGDHWLGKTRLSLVNSADGRLLDTINIVGPCFIGDPADSFRLPFLVPNYYYDVPHQNSKHEGKPTIMHLRDLTGDGVATEFVLFKYGACGIVDTSVFGYNPLTDRAIQYPVQVFVDAYKPEFQTWVEQVFATKPIRPGKWNFTWKPGHGMENYVIHEDVSFDSGRQLFVERRKTTQSK
jgi:hypothetical protein